MSKSIKLEKENIRDMKSCLCRLYIVCSSPRCEYEIRLVED